MNENKQPKIKIIRSDKSSDSYFYSNTDYFFKIVDLKSDKTVDFFQGSWFSNVSGGDKKEGVESVLLQKDGKTIAVKYFDGSEMMKTYE